MSRLVSLPCLAVLATAVTAGQTPASAEKCSLAGAVLSARSGAPLRRAEVHLRPAAGRTNYSTTTQSGGQFVFSNVQPGRYRLSAERPGYAAQEYGSSAPGLPGEILTLQCGVPAAPLVIRLIPLGAIAGKVSDEDGEPVPDVRVQALRYTYAPGGGRLTAARVASTNDLGEYRLYGLSPGRYYLSAEYHSPDASDPAGATSFAPTFYPGASNPASAVALEIPAGGESLGADFSLQRTRSVRVRGRVGNVPSDRAVRNVSVVMVPRTAAGFGATFSRSAAAQEPAGNFEIPDAIPGSYVIAAYTVEPGQRHTAWQSIDVGSADVSGVELILSPAADLTGRVSMDAGVDRRPGGLTVLLRPRVPLPAGGFSGRSKDDGTILIEGVASGEYAMDISGVPDGLYVKSARIAGIDALASGLAVQGGRSPGDLEVLLGADGGKIDGRLTGEDQDPAASVHVVLIPEPALRGQSHRYRTTTTDQDGRFALSGIAPGDYKIFAWEDLGAGDFRDPDFIKHFEDLGTVMRVRSHGRENVELRVIRPGTG